MRTDLRSWVRTVLRVLRASGRPMLVVQSCCALPVVLLSLPFAAIEVHGTVNAVRAVVVGLVALGFAALGQAASVFLAIREAAGVRTAPTTALRAGAGRTVRLLGWGLVATVLMSIGLTLGVLPGLYVAVVGLAGLSGVVVVERRGLRRAAALVNRRLLAMSLRCLVGLFVAAVYAATAGTLLDLVSDGSDLGGPTGLVVGVLIALPLSVAGTAFTVSCYAELRRRADGAEVGDLAAALH